MIFFRSFFILLKSIVLALLISMSFPLTASAAVDIYAFDTDSQRERYHMLSEVLRCPKCQNQNLAGSNSEISEDLRRELHRLLIEGKSDKEIKGFMVARYGDFVLYKTPLKSSTIALWLLPVALILGGAISLLLIVRQRAKVAVGITNNSLSDTEQQQLDDLLKKAPTVDVPSAEKEPLADKKPLADKEPSANKQSSADNKS
ncbi:MAG: cytochrome c-type biogenesis protein CcmH [Cellvibrionaceae bacterium]|jgi:cytochrome c-type biogenesis protein CcmH